MITLGIDPGLDGAIGALRDGAFLAVEDMPTVIKGDGMIKREVDSKRLIEILKSISPADEPGALALERVGAMPGQGSSSTFSLGDSYGAARTAVIACRFELHVMTPSAWKKHFFLSRDKNESIALAQELFPTAPIKLKKHADRAEALLMARWLYETRFA